MAKKNGKKMTIQGQNSRRRPHLKKHPKRLRNNISSHPSSVPLITSSENHALAPVADNKDEFSGYIFMCSGKTKPECYINRVFGLPSGRREVVEKIKPGTKLFLYDFDSKLLYGVYEASSNGEMNLEPSAFGGHFPAQVRFSIYKEVLPLPLSTFRHAIKDNYQGSKFAPELNTQQVRSLMSLFRPIDAISSGPPRQHPSTYGTPEAQRISATKLEWINSLLATQSLNPHVPNNVGPQMHNLPQHIIMPQPGQQNGLNPHLHYIPPPGAHQAPPPPSHHPYQSYDGHREPVVNHVDGYMGQSSYPMQAAGFGYPHMRPTDPYGGPAYVHSQGHEVVDRSMPASSYYSFPGGLRPMH